MFYTLAFYQIEPIENPRNEVIKHKEYLQNLDAKARIYISEEGINGQASFAREDALKYIDWMHARKEFAKVQFKIDEWHEHVFPKLTVKYRKQLVALDKKVDFTKKGEHISPKEFRETLESSEPHILLDVRNDYEWAVGHFEGARLPKHATFREFDAWANELKKEVNPEKTKVLMYCTGGIRCELYSSLLKESGFDNVKQLSGGVIEYGHKEGSAKWKGKLFVFDDRLTVPLNHEKTEVIGQCHHCQTPNESYYNCANMDCNELFLCCKECLNTHKGCCQESCTSGRVRPYEEQNAHKPFRKWYKYFDNKEVNQS